MLSERGFDMLKIGIDAGHGGIDSGATGKTEDGRTLKEKDVNLTMALSLGEFLTSTGLFEVFYTRITDRYMTIQQRANMLNAWDVDYAISVHNNASVSGKADGFEAIHTLYVNGEGDELANQIASSVNVETGQNVRRVFFRKNSRGQDYYGMNRLTKMTTVIVEGAFIDNPKDNNLVDTVAEQKLFGQAIGIGVVKHVKPSFSYDGTIRFLGMSAVSLEQMLKWAEDRFASTHFILMAPIYYKLCKDYGFKAEAMYSQLAKHTSLDDVINFLYDYLIGFVGCDAKEIDEIFTNKKDNVNLVALCRTHLYLVSRTLILKSQTVAKQESLKNVINNLSPNFLSDADIDYSNSDVSLNKYSQGLVRDYIRPMLATEVTGCNEMSQLLYELALEKIDSMGYIEANNLELKQMVETLIDSYQSFEEKE